MVRDELSLLAALVAVAEERSFTKAAKRLGVSPSALSHAIRRLEEHVGARLLARTTRSVAPTEAGQTLIDRLKPALGDIRGALGELSGMGDRAVGRVRIVASPLAATMVLAPKLGEFTQRYPDVVVEVVTTNEGRFDLVAGGFDAGIHLGEFIERDMIAVRVSPDQRAAIVGAPKYFDSHAAPVTPHDLTHHRCLNFSHGTSGIYRWEFDRAGQSVTVGVRGPLVVDDAALMIRAAIDGAGLAFTLEAQVASQLSSGALVRVLDDWCEPFAGYFMYYPSRRHQPAALSALIAALRI